MERDIILSALLDKYEKSKHLLEPGMSKRRVALVVGKKDIPSYNYENAEIRDAYNHAALTLEADGLITIEWIKGRPVIAAVYLNLAKVEDAYKTINRMHPRDLAEFVCQLVDSEIGNVSVPWILDWKEEITRRARVTYRIPDYCRNDSERLKGLLTVLAAYDALDGKTVTMRAFSIQCFHDSKRFEQDYRELFLRIARKYAPIFQDVCEDEKENLSSRDQLALLGIYTRPELYELSGACSLVTDNGVVDVGAAGSFGLAIPCTSVDEIQCIDLRDIQRVVFIENKTNYDEYLMGRKPDELVIYHGGFLSPQKTKLFRILSNSLTREIKAFFWADIDLGGFEMFYHLKELIPTLEPMRMSAADIEQYKDTGLPRNDAYLSRLRDCLASNRYPLFDSEIRKILAYGLTIEQEVFLSSDRIR